MAYVNYMAIDARCVVVEAKLEKSAVDRLSRNTDLRYDELTNRTAVRQIREALGNKQIKDKGARQGAKWVIKLLTTIYPDASKDEVAAEIADKEIDTKEPILALSEVPMLSASEMEEANLD